jgi:hypothetical protein
MSCTFFGACSFFSYRHIKTYKARDPDCDDVNCALCKYRFRYGGDNVSKYLPANWPLNIPPADVPRNRRLSLGPTHPLRKKTL